MASQQRQKERKTILITGATGGIGKASAIAFARTGEYDLALHYNSASINVRNDLLHAINDVLTTAIDVSYFQADLGDYDAVRKLHKDVSEQFGDVDVLYNNAGTSAGCSGPKDLGEVSLEVFEQAWRVNCGSPILLTQLCLPGMQRQKWGRVVFCSSLAASTGGLVGPHYASSKSALHGFIYWLGGNVARQGITVNAVAPALIADTAILPRPDTEEKENQLASKIPVGRLGTPQEIAETVLWMVNTAYVTRKVITVDGGMQAS